MKATRMIFFTTLGLMILLTAVYHTAKHLFGWTDYGHWPEAVVAAISGAGAALIVEFRLRRAKRRQGSAG